MSHFVRFLLPFKNITFRILCAFQPTLYSGNVVPDPSVDYLLFDRVVNVRDNIAVPFGYRGTVIGVHEGRRLHSTVTRRVQ